MTNDNDGRIWLCRVVVVVVRSVISSQGKSTRQSRAERAKKERKEVLRERERVGKELRNVLSGAGNTIKGQSRRSVFILFLFLSLNDCLFVGSIEICWRWQGWFPCFFSNWGKNSSLFPHPFSPSLSPSFFPSLPTGQID